MSGIDCITLTTNNNQITAVLTQDDELVANVTLSVTETGLSVEVNNATEQVFQAGIEIIDNEAGEDFIRVEYQGMALMFGYYEYDNVVQFAIYEGVNGNALAILDVRQESDSVEVGIRVVSAYGDLILKGAVTFTAAEGELTVDIDLDHLLIYEAFGETYFEECYIEFDGAITFKVA